MQRYFNFFVCSLALVLFSTTLSRAEVEITLNSGNTLQADCIQWGPDSTLILEQKNQQPSSLSLNKIERLKIENSVYDQETIQLAADQYYQGQSVQFAFNN